MNVAARPREADGLLPLAVGVGCAQDGPATMARGRSALADCSEPEVERGIPLLASHLGPTSLSPSPRTRAHALSNTTIPIPPISAAVNPTQWSVKSQQGQTGAPPTKHITAYTG